MNTARKQRIKAAEVVRDGRLLINAEMADELWAKNSRRRRGVFEPQPAVAPPPGSRPPTNQEIKAFIEDLPEDQIPEDVNESIRRKEHYNAERQRVAALKDRGEVVSTRDVKSQAFALARAVRDGMMGIPDRLAPQLAASTDARQVHQLLTEEIRVALRGLGNG